MCGGFPPLFFCVRFQYFGVLHFDFPQMSSGKVQATADVPKMDGRLTGPVTHARTHAQTHRHKSQHAFFSPPRAPQLGESCPLEQVHMFGREQKPSPQEFRQMAVGKGEGAECPGGGKWGGFEWSSPEQRLGLGARGSPAGTQVSLGWLKMEEATSSPVEGVVFPNQNSLEWPPVHPLGRSGESGKAALQTPVSFLLFPSLSLPFLSLFFSFFPHFISSSLRLSFPLLSPPPLAPLLFFLVESHLYYFCN